MADKKVIVRCQKLDCFGNMKCNSEYGICKVLQLGFDYECPFYKTKEEYDEGIRKYGGILKFK